MRSGGSYVLNGSLRSGCLKRNLGVGYRGFDDIDYRGGFRVQSCLLGWHIFCRRIGSPLA